MSEPRFDFVGVDAKPGWEVMRQTDSANGDDGGPKIGEPWRDFRKEGEPLWPSRIGTDELQRMATAMGTGPSDFS